MLRGSEHFFEEEANVLHQKDRNWAFGDDVS